jgi:DNA polymerase III alpha subunit
VKKVGMAAMQAVVAARGDTPFADLADFADRIDPRQLNKMQIENLAKAGAFDRWNQPCAPVRRRRNDLRRAQAQAEETAESGQIGLFGGCRAARSRCACPTCRTGRCWSGWRSRPRRSASTSPRIRWTPTCRCCGAWV